MRAKASERNTSYSIFLLASYKQFDKVCTDFGFQPRLDRSSVLKNS